MPGVTSSFGTIVYGSAVRFEFVAALELQTHYRNVINNTDAFFLELVFSSQHAVPVLDYMMRHSCCDVFQTREAFYAI